MPIELTSLSVTAGKGKWLETDRVLGEAASGRSSSRPATSTTTPDQTGSSTDASLAAPPPQVALAQPRQVTSGGGYRMSAPPRGRPARRVGARRRRSLTGARRPSPRTDLNTVLFAEYAPHDCVRRRVCGRLRRGGGSADLAADHRDGVPEGDAPNKAGTRSASPGRPSQRQDQRSASRSTTSPRWSRRSTSGFRAARSMRVTSTRPARRGE